MPLGNHPRGRAAYNPIAASEDVEQGVTGTTPLSAGQPTSREASRSRIPRRRRNDYNRIAVADVDDDDDTHENDDAGNNSILDDDHSTHSTNHSVVLSSSSSSSDDSTNQNHRKDPSKEGATATTATSVPEKDDGRRITLVVLDFAQAKFRVAVHPSWTVGRFKTVGATVHKVAPSRQRLIYRGKMLEDARTLEDSGITADETIVHLFPKPRVVITTSNHQQSSSSSSSSNNNSSSGADDPASSSDAYDEETGGARVPTIVMDEEEAGRRSQILVLGSTEYAESQSHVKLFSFMLLIISSIELLNLLAIALGVPPNGRTATGSVSSNGYSAAALSEDDIFADTADSAAGHTTNGYYHSSSSSSTSSSTSDAAAELLGQWSWLNNADLLISSLGVYVALLGLKASSQHTLKLARYYLWGTVVTGIAWLIFNYIVTVDVSEREQEDEAMKHHHASNSNTSVADDDFTETPKSELYQQGFQVMIIPAMVWFMCCLRAWQFHHLLEEAEEDARNRLDPHDTDDDDDDDDEGNDEVSQEANGVEHYQRNGDLALQSESAELA